MRPGIGYTPPTVSIGGDASDGTTRRSFGIPFRVVTIARGPIDDTVVAVQPLALLGDGVVGGVLLAVLVQWWRRRRAAR